MAERKEDLVRDKGACQRCSRIGTIWLLPSLNSWLCENCLYQVIGENPRDQIEE